jgi:hypothetical protein
VQTVWPPLLEAVVLPRALPKTSCMPPGTEDDPDWGKNAGENDDPVTLEDSPSKPGAAA